MTRLRPLAGFFAVFAALTVPLLAGEASGEFKAGTRDPIRPKYAAAFETRDQRDGRKRAVEVVLSEAPINVAAAIAELDPHSNVINQPALWDHNYILLWVRPDGDISMNATYAAKMTQFVDMTSMSLKSEMTANTPGRVAGRLFSPKPVKTDTDTWTVDVKFSTDVARLPAGTKLPADGGEPGKAFRALLTAMSKKSWEGIKSNVTPKHRQSFTNRDDALQSLGMWLPAKGAKVIGGELRGDTADLEVAGELFAGVKGLYLVRMVKDGPRWVFDQATRSGLLD